MNENSVPADTTATSSAEADQSKVVEKDLGSNTSAFEKLLREKKNAMSKIQELEKQIKESNQQKLIEKEEWKTLAEQRQTEFNELKNKFDEKEKMISDSIKLAEVRRELSKLGMMGDYLDDAGKFVDIGSISYDPETGIVTNADSAAKVVYEKFTPLFRTAPVKGDHSAPVGNAAPLTVDEWKNLSPEDREKRYPELMKSLGHELRK